MPRPISLLIILLANGEEDQVLGQWTGKPVGPSNRILSGSDKVEIVG